MRTAFASLVCCLLTLGCRADPPKRTIMHTGNATEARKEILKLIPVGTPLGRAEGTLVKNGFQRMQDPSKWTEPRAGTAPTPAFGKTAEDDRCLTYWIDEPADFLVTRTWYVQLYQEAGAVEDIKVKAGGLTGP